MSLDFMKVVYVDGETVITADNLNDIQDAILELDDEKYEKPSGGIPSSDLNSSAQAMLLPSGGTVGQVLSKKSSSNYDVEWADGGSGGTSDYTDLTNKPQINSHTLTGNQSAADLGLGTYSKPSGGIPDTDLSSAVQASLAKADTALQTAPVTSVNSKTGAVVLSASDVGAYSIPSGGIPDTDLSSSVQASLANADTAYQKPSGGIPDTDLSAAVQTSLGKADTALQTAPVSSVDGKTGAVVVLPTGGTSGQVLKKNSSTDYDVFWGNDSGGGGGGTSDYTDLTNKPQINSVTLSGNLSAADLGLGTYSKPSGGIPDTDLSSSVQTSLGLADTAYQKPSGGIPDTDLTSAVKTSLGLADTAYQKPSGGIPASDIASGVIPSASSATPQDLGVAAAGSSADFSRADHVHDMPSASDIGAYVKPSGGIPASDLASGVIPTVPTAYTSNPEMDGTASPGSSTSWAKGDHVHPTDTSRAASDIVAIQSAQPSSSTNKLWIKEESGNGVEIPTVAEMQSLIAISFAVTLDDASWSNSAQTVSNANFLASGYGYIVTPASASFADYAAAVIYADNVTTDGSMTFHCSTAPSSDLTVNILRVVSA